MKIASVARALPPYRFRQQEIFEALARHWKKDLAKPELLSRFHHRVGVETRYFVLPLDGYDNLTRWGDANRVWLEKAEELGEQAIDLALEVLKKLHANGITGEQLGSAKSYLKGQFPPMIETSGQLARLIVRHEFLGLDDSEVNQFEQRIDGVTPEMAKQAIAKHFPMESLTFTLVGKAPEIAPMVKKYADKQDEKEISAPGFWPGSK